MTKNQKVLIQEISELYGTGKIELSDAATAGLEEFNTIPAAPKFTDKGIQILKYMQKNYEQYNNVLKAKDIGEAIGLTGRTVSGSIRKLVTDGYVEKIGTNPVCYSITDLGKVEKFDN